VKPRERESLLTDVGAMFVGVAVIAVSYARQFNHIEYLPGDIRGEPWFDPAVAIVFAIGGLFAFLIGSIRLVQGHRARSR
jgi:hypothetical protein